MGEMTYRELIEGKRVAAVGPAPAPYDQSAEVDAHDVVIRFGFDHWPWAGYGDRVDVVGLDGHHSGLFLQGRLPVAVPEGAWCVLKMAPDVGWPRVHTADWQYGGNPLQLTLILNDLRRFGPADVTVFGANFYVEPFRAYAESDWEFGESSDPVTGRAWARYVLGQTNTAHDHYPKQDMARIRAIRDEFGWPNGDERFMRVLAMSDDEYDAAIAGWL
jgi:hypothetical protein